MTVKRVLVLMVGGARQYNIIFVLIDEPFERGHGGGMTGAGTAVAAADKHRKHGKQSADNSGHQHDGSDRRRHVDAVAAAAHHHRAFSAADDLHALGHSVQHHLEQSVNMRD